MCFFGGGAKAAPAPKKAEYEDAPPVVTGKQTGVDDPKDTKKATDKLRMDRKKREGTKRGKQHIPTAKKFSQK